MTEREFTDVKKEEFAQGESVVSGLYAGKLTKHLMMEIVGINSLAISDYWAEIVDQHIMFCLVVNE